MGQELIAQPKSPCRQLCSKQVSCTSCCAVQSSASLISWRDVDKEAKPMTSCRWITRRLMAAATFLMCRSSCLIQCGLLCVVYLTLDGKLDRVARLLMHVEISCYRN